MTLFLLGLCLGAAGAGVLLLGTLAGLAHRLQEAERRCAFLTAAILKRGVKLSLPAEKEE